MSTKSSRRARIAGILLATAAAISLSSEAMAQEARRRFNIPAQDATTALQAYARQSGRQVLFSYDAVRGRRAPAVRGEFSNDDALNRLIAGTGLVITSSDGSTVTLRAGEAQAGGAPAETEGVDAQTGVAEILVVGSRSLNADIARREDDAQPYVVLGSDEIRQSQAQNVEEFLRTRLPMNSQAQSNAQAGSGLAGNQSQINLRGLGTNQTLVLVDGRRMPSIPNFAEGNFGQADVNGIPLAAIDRIEVLPGTASGIYGGGATGGVVNIILNRNYSGITVQTQYRDTFQTHAPSLRVDLSAGVSLNDGRTRLLAAYSRETSDPLLVGDRTFAQDARDLQSRNNPSTIGAFSPPVGLTPNIRNSVGGVLVLDNGTPLTSNFTSVPVGYVGPQSDGGAAFLGRSGQYNYTLSNDLFGARQSLLNDPEISSLLLSGRQSIGSRVEIFLDLMRLTNKGQVRTAGVSNNLFIVPGNAPTNPFTTAVQVVLPFPGLEFESVVRSRTTRASGGAIIRLPYHWSASLEYAWNESRVTSRRTEPGLDPVAINNAISNGTLNVFSDVNLFQLNLRPYRLPSPNLFAGPFDTILQTTSVRTSGPLFDVGGGNLELTALLEYRNEKAQSGFQDRLDFASAVPQLTYYPSKTQDVRSAYAEVRAPFFSDTNDRPLLRLLELQASVRREEYGTRSVASIDTAIIIPNRDTLPTPTYFQNRVSSNSYTAALLYSPVRGVTLRGSYATGFLPPSLAQIGQSTGPALLSTRDPRRGNQRVSTELGPDGQVVRASLISGGNPDLEPERSRSFAVGLILQPQFLPGFRMSIDYVNIRKRGEIGSLSTTQILANEDQFPGRVSRLALTPADSARGFTGGIITSINRTLFNFSRTDVEAIDVQADYSFSTTGAGRFHLFGVGTYQPHFKRQATPLSPLGDLVNFSNGPLSWRGSVGLEWTRNRLSAAWNTQIYGSYRFYSTFDDPAQAVVAQGAARIGVQTFSDLTVAYRLPRPFAQVSELEIRAGIQNIFAQRPALINAFYDSNGYSSYGDPQLRRFSLSVRAAF